MFISYLNVWQAMMFCAMCLFKLVEKCLILLLEIMMMMEDDKGDVGKKSFSHLLTCGKFIPDFSVCFSGPRSC